MVHDENRHRTPVKIMTKFWTAAGPAGAVPIQGKEQRMSGFKDAPPDDRSEMTPEQESAIRIVANNLHRLNDAVVKAVEAGVTVELMRTARYHNEVGNWGDQLTPVIRPGK
jgi:hypothetical protein